MKKIFICFSVAAALLFGAIGLAPASVYAADDDSTSCGDSAAFFALRPWYHGLTEPINGKCEVKKPSGDGLPQFVWSIVLNILYDIMIMVGYIAIVMIAWGGYLYMFSRGMPDRAERGKKTLIAAVAGLAVAMLASIIMNTLVTILTNVS